MSARFARLGPGDAGTGCLLVKAFKGRCPGGKAMRTFLEHPRNVLLGAWVGDAPAAMLIAYLLPRADGAPDMTFIYEIEVAASHRRQGLARQLMAALHALAPAKSFVLTNAANSPAMALYQATGGRRPNPDDVLFEFPG